MIDEIKARTDLTDKEKQEAIAKLNQLKEQAIQDNSTCAKHR